MISGFTVLSSFRSDGRTAPTGPTFDGYLDWNTPTMCSVPCSANSSETMSASPSPAGAGAPPPTAYGITSAPPPAVGMDTPDSGAVTDGADADGEGLGS